MRIPEIGTVVAQAERAERARLGRHHVHRLAEPRRRPVRGGRAGGGRDRAAAVRDRRHQRLHAPSGGARQRRGDGAGDVGRPVRARHRPRRHRAVPPRAEADAGRRVHRVGHRPAALSRQRDDRLQRPPEPAAVARSVPAAEGPARHRGVGPAHDRVRGAHRRARHARGRRRSRSGRVGDRPRAQGRGRRRARSGARSRSART